MSGILTPGTISAQFHQQDNEFAVPSAVSGMSPEGPVVIAFGGMRKRLVLAAQFLAAGISAGKISVTDGPTPAAVFGALEHADALIELEQGTWEGMKRKQSLPEPPPPSPLVGV